jgi:hypothetical protein
MFPFVLAFLDGLDTIMQQDVATGNLLFPLATNSCGGMSLFFALNGRIQRRASRWRNGDRPSGLSN